MKCNCRNSLRMLIISPLASGPSPDDRDKLKSNSAGPKPDSDHYHYLVFWRLEPQYLLFLSLTRKAATADITQWRGLIGESEATRGYFISSKLIKSKLAFRLSPAPRLAVKMSNLGCLIMSSQDPDLGHLAIWQVEMSGEERTEELTREAGRGWTPTLCLRQCGCLLYQADTGEHWGTLRNTGEHWATRLCARRCWLVHSADMFSLRAFSTDWQPGCRPGLTILGLSPLPSFLSRPKADCPVPAFLNNLHFLTFVDRK